MTKLSDDEHEMIADAAIAILDKLHPRSAEQLVATLQRDDAAARHFVAALALAMKIRHGI